MIHGFVLRLLVEADVLAWWASDVSDPKDQAVWWLWWNNLLTVQKAVPSY